MLANGRNGPGLVGSLLVAAGSIALASEGLQANAPSSWSATVERQIADSEYQVTWQDATAQSDLESSWQAPNRAHGFRTYFTDGGIRVIPRVEVGENDSTAAPSWEWALSLARWGRPGSMQEVAPAEVTVTGNEVQYDRGPLVERYLNDRRGLEQIFVIEAVPSEGDEGFVHLDIELSGTLSPVIAEDGQAIDFATPSGVKVLHYAQLRVVDSRGDVLPAWMRGFTEPGLRGIRLVFDDTGAVYPVTVDPLTTSSSWSAEGNQAGAFFGWSVATAGDVNGDGYSDVIVGAYLYDNGDANEGRVYVYHGSPAGLAASPAWTAGSNQAGAQFGWSVAPAGDVDGDGYSDVIVGANQHDNGETDEGRVYIYQGSAAGLAANAAWSAESDQVSAKLGDSVATAGDVNGDGYSDVIVGANQYDNGQPDEGRAWVYHGSAAGLAAIAAWTAESNQVIAWFAHAVASAGDVNSDGYSDVLVGSYLYDNGQSDEGRVYVYHGSAAGLAASPAWTAESDQAGAQFGWSVAPAGDVNGDGFADVVVGANLYSNGQTQEGRAWVYHGSAAGLAASAGWTAESNQLGAQLGRSVGTAGDVNGDGYADVIVGAFQYDASQVNEGRAWVHLGSAAGLAANAVWTAESDQDGANFGVAVGTAGDVNGDGYSDVILGAHGYDNGEQDEGQAFVYHGSAGGLGFPAWTREGEQAGAELGSSVTTAGDVNGDGFSDVIVGAYRYDNGQSDEGRALLYLGSATGLATSAAWTAEGDQENAYLGSSVATAGDVNGDGYSDVAVVSLGQAEVYLGSVSGLGTSASFTTADAPYSFRNVAPAGDVNGDGYADILLGQPGYTNGQNSEGRISLYLGSASGPAPNASWILESNQAQAELGLAIATAGDVNGDGFSDVIVGIANYSNSQLSEGRAYVYHGSPSGLAAAASWTAESNQTNADFGTSVATAGDVDGDGYSDVIISAPAYDNGVPGYRGRAFVYHGSASGLGTSAPWTADGTQGSEFGNSVATAGDVNGDGYSDVIVGAYYWTIGSGRAYVYLGSAAGLAASAAWTGSGQDSAQFGWSVAPAGDVNGDGYADVIVGANLYSNGQTDEGSAFLYYGGGGDGLDRIPRQARTDGTTPVALLGKSDSETEFRLRARGRTPAGRGDMRLEWEVKPLGTPFDGTGLDSSPVEYTSFPGASGSSTSFNEPVTGLSEGTFYHWRSRIVSTDPYFPRSRWMSLAGNNVTETKLRTAGCVDRDGDGYGDLGDPSCLSLVPDCDNDDPTSWDTPGEPENLRFTSKTTLVWDAPTAPGGLLVYDTLRSGIAANFLLAECVESDDGPDTTATDTDTPSGGQVFFYLTRAQSGCPQGTGSLGTDSSGNPRMGADCP